MAGFNSTYEVVSETVFDSYAEKQLVAALFGLVSFTGVLGNSTVLLAVVLSRKPRTTTNVFVVNLAVTDFFASLCLPIMILAVLSENREKLLVSETLCTFQGYVSVVAVGCSLNNISSIAVYRALVTRRRNQSRLISLFQRRGLVAMVAANWIIPVALGLLPSGFGSYGYSAELSTCSFNLKSNGSATYSKILSAVFYFVQFVVIFVSSAVILFTVRRRGRRFNVVPPQPPAVVGRAMRLPSRRATRMQLHLSVHGDISTGKMSLTPNRLLVKRRVHRAWTTHRSSTQSASADPPQIRQPLLRRNREVTRTLFIVVFVFMICCTPYLVAMALLANRFQKFVPFLGVLIFSNSCVNPVIYTARHPDFKVVCRCIIQCKFYKIPLKSAFLRSLLSAQEM